MQGKVSRIMFVSLPYIARQRLPGDREAVGQTGLARRIDPLAGLGLGASREDQRVVDELILGSEISREGERVIGPYTHRERRGIPHPGRRSQAPQRVLREISEVADEQVRGRIDLDRDPDLPEAPPDPRLQGGQGIALGARVDPLRFLAALEEISAREVIAH